MKAKVDGGLYNNASEVVRQALRFIDTHEQWIHEIKLANCAYLSQKIAQAVSLVMS